MCATDTRIINQSGVPNSSRRRELNVLYESYRTHYAFLLQVSKLLCLTYESPGTYTPSADIRTHPCRHTFCYLLHGIAPRPPHSQLLVKSYNICCIDHAVDKFRYCAVCNITQSTHSANLPPQHFPLASIQNASFAL